MHEENKRLLTGSIDAFEDGHISGRVVIDPVSSEINSVTIEVFAHGIRVVSAEIETANADSDGTVAFRIPVTRFPRVTLPVRLTARIVETDAILHSEVSIADLGNLWDVMFSYRPQIKNISHGRIILKIPAQVLHPDQEIFELRESSAAIGRSVPIEMDMDGSSLFAIELPDSLYDGEEHVLYIVHLQSSLQVNQQPINVSLNVSLTSQPSMFSLLAQLEALEHRVDNAYANAFRDFGLPLYRHVDRLTMKQRSNFEREIAAIRKLHNLPHTPNSEPYSEGLFSLPMADNIRGYGFSPVVETSTGKKVRRVGASFGLLLPAFLNEPLKLVVQGLQIDYEKALVGAELFLNGIKQVVVPYNSPTSTSWNISCQLSQIEYSGDQNLLEVRIPNGQDPRLENQQKWIGAVLEVRVEANISHTPQQPESEHQKETEN